MYFRFFIVTYNNDTLLQGCLDSIYAMKIPDNTTFDVYVINNYGNMTKTIKGKTYETLQIINNEGRPDFSTGHLSRNWNQGILLGFEDIENPKCDAVVLVQNDAEFVENFLHNLLLPLETYDYICLGKGDEVQIIKPEAIHSIGLYDERFCNIGFQEGDYLLRALLFNTDKSSITDDLHGRHCNPLNNDIFLKPTAHSTIRNDDELHRRAPHFHLQYRIWVSKWGDRIGDTRWHTQFLLQHKEQIKPSIKQNMFYPYFEMKLQNLAEKYFVF